MARVVESPKKKLTMHFDLKEEDLAGLELGEEIAVLVKGKVKSLALPYEFERHLDNGKIKLEKDPYGSLSVNVLEYTVETGDLNEFEQLIEEDE